MLVYPVPVAVTQARVQLVADQTEKAPAPVIQDDVLNILAARKEAEQRALDEYSETQTKEGHVDVKA